MTDHPILFSAPMVRAILEGRKTMTRRVMKIQPPNDGKEYQAMRILDGDKRNIGKIRWIKEQRIVAGVPPFSCPFGVIGDRLWVKETWKPVPETAYRLSPGAEYVINPSDPHEAAIYKCGWELSPGSGHWKPSIFMPRWASRITLQITNIRAERVQDISHDDAIAEGVCEYCSECRNGTPDQPCEGCGAYNKAREAFIKVWDSINGKKPDRCWDANPWVWVVEFERVS